MNTRTTTPLVSLDAMMFRVASVCAHYRVPTGRPTDMAGLLEKLEADKGLALDFWMVVTQMIGDGDEAPGVGGNERARHARLVQERALDAIARVMTGFGAAELRRIDADARQAVMLMASELAGRDPRFGVMVDEPQVVNEAAAVVEVQAVASTPASAVAAQAVVAVEAMVAEETTVAEAPVVAAEAMPTPARETIQGAAEIYREALRARFDQEWYEYQMEEVAAASAARAREAEMQAAAAKIEEAPAAEVVVEAAARGAVRDASARDAERRGPETRVWFADEAARAEEDDFRQQLFGEGPEVADPLGARPVRLRLPMWMRMWGRAWRPVAPARERSGGRATLTLALVVLLLAGAAVVRAQRSGLLGQGMFARYEGMVRDAVASLTTPAEASASVAVEGSAGSEAGDGTTRAVQLAKRPRAGGAGVAKVAPIEAGDATPVRFTTKESSTIAREVSSAVAQSVSSTISQRESGVVGAGAPAQAAAFADGAPVHIEGATVSSGLGGPIAVASPVMSVDLISSPAAQYAAVAGTGPVDGRVVLHALISKSGAVEELQVLDGDPLLRPAAIRTVSGWRYRPYLVNGEPVEVATTITVNFKIDY
jgi:outer membrane biosynthesis protein TonB